MKNNRKSRVPIRNILLRVLLGTGAISLALCAPNMARMLKHFDRATVQRDKLYKRISEAVRRAEKEGLLTVSGEWGSRRVVLTEKGKELARQAEFDTGYHIPEPAFWDGKWRVLMFDMSERRRRTRDQLRRMLQNIGFVRLQDSVWVHPYPCDEFIQLVRAHLRSGVGELRFLVADALESDSALRRHFKL